MRRRLIRLAHWSAALSIAMLVMVTLALSTTTGQRLAIQIAANVLSSPQQRIAVAPLDGSVFSRGRIPTLTVSDADGVWLEMRDLAFHWSPQRLLSNTLAIHALDIASVDIKRRPRAHPERNTNTPRPNGSRTLASLPAMAVLAEHVAITDIRLGQDVVGVPATLRLEGQGELIDPASGLHASINVTRIDGPGGHMKGRFAFSPQTEELAVTVAMAEPQGGLLARLLELPNLPSVAVDVTGRGALADWHATMSARANDVPFFAGTADIRKSQATYQLTANAEGFLEHLVPAPVAPLFAGRTTANLDMAFDDGGGAVMRTAHLKSDSLQADLSGALDPVTLGGVATLAVRATRDDGGPLVFPLQNNQSVSFAQADISARLSTAAGALRPVDVTVRIDKLSAAEVIVGQLEVRATGQLNSATSQAKLALSKLQAIGEARAITSRDARLSALLGTGMSFAMEGRADRRGFEISALDVNNALVHATGTIKGHPGSTITGNLKLASADLRPLSPLLGQTISGSAGVMTTITFARDTGGASASLQGQLQNLGLTDTSGQRRDLGDAELSGDIHRTESGDLDIRDVKIVNRIATAQIDGQLSAKRVQLKTMVTVDQIGQLSPGLTGALTLSATADGDAQTMTTQIDLAAKNFGRPKQARADITAAFAGSGTRQMQSGPLRVNGQINGDPLAGTALIRADIDGGFDISELKANILSARLSGSARKLPQQNPVADLSVIIADLGAFAAVVGKPLSGQISARAKLSETASDVDVAVMAKRMTVDGLDVRDLKINGRQAPDGGYPFTATASLDGKSIALGGTAEIKDSATALTLTTANLSANGQRIALSQPGTIRFNNQNPRRIEMAPLRLAIRSGTATVSGDITGDTLNVKVALKQLPAEFAQLFDPTLALTGRIDGQAAITGTTAAPQSDAQILWSDAGTTDLKRQGLTGVNVAATTHSRGNIADTTVTVTGRDGLRLQAVGRVPTKAKGELAMQLEGVVPLSLANPMLADRGARAGGTAAVRGNVSGQLANPNIATTLTLKDAQFSDPSNGLKFAPIIGTVRVSERGVVFDNLVANSQLGGQIAVTGRVSFAGDQASAATPVCDLSVQMTTLKFDDRQLMSGEADGRLTIKGPMSNLVASGSIRLNRVDITVPNQLPKSVVDLDLRHSNAPERIRRVQANEQKASASKQSSLRVPLNINITAANRIFVRGRGLDALLGGQLQLRGTSDEPVADGGFAMERGRLAILGRQLEFKRGKISFYGSMEPRLDMEASAPADGVTITVLVTGPASKPKFRFSSQPQLPEDEVVARLLFNSSLAKLSPVQLTQLAGEIDKIGGLSSGPSTLDQLKGSLGLDVLDINTDDQGSASVTAGSYLNDKTYVGVKQGTGPTSSRIIIDHSLTKNLKAKGELGADGNSKLGVGVEWDY